MEERRRTGGCLCGGVRYAFGGEPLAVSLCHCSVCRRASAAPMTGWILLTRSQVIFEGELSAYASSPGAERRFCPRCGGQIAFVAEYMPGLIDLTLGTVDAPEQIPPQFHYWEGRRLPWLKINDGLPRHAGFPPFGEP